SLLPIIGLHPDVTIFPYTALFRSDRDRGGSGGIPPGAGGGRGDEGGCRELAGVPAVSEEAWIEGRGAVRQRQVPGAGGGVGRVRSEEHTSELQSRENLVCRLQLEK